MLILRQGDTGPDVQRLQLLLNSMLIPSPCLKADGEFGQRTHDAVIAFQKLHGMATDGVVASRTWLALGQKLPGRPSTQVSVSRLSTQVVLGPKWLEIAEAELGIHENSFPGQETQRIIEYHSTTTLKATTDETPWCSSFVNWVMKQAGYKGTSSAAAKSWLMWGKGLTAPKLGAVTVIKKKGASSDAATGSTSGFHVALYISHSQSHVRLLGGNQGDQVKYSNFSLAAYDVKAYRWVV